MEPTKGKYASTNKDFFLKMRSQQAASAKLIADKLSDNSSADQKSDSKDAEKVREKERRQKEKEEYARQKAILEKEEEEKQQLAEKKRKEKEAAAVSIQAVMHEQTDSLLNNAPPHSSNQSAPHEDQSQCNNDKPSVKSVQQDEKEVIEQSLQTTSDAAENQLETNTRSKECIKKDGSAIVDSTAHPNNADTNTESRANTEVSSEMKNDPSNTTSSRLEFSDKLYRCEALISYTAKTSKELSFEQGDIIYVPRAANVKQRILKGVCKGKEGIFPGHLVKDTASNERLGDPALHYKLAVKCYVIGNYAASKKNELTIKQGETVHVPVLHNSTMIQVVCNGQSGLVPRRLIVDEDERAEIQHKPAAAEIVRCQAVRPFQGRPGWLTFDYNDIILVPKKCTGKVWQGVCKGNVGKFFAAYVVNTEEYTPDEIDQMVAENKTMLSKRKASLPADEEAKATNTQPVPKMESQDVGSEAFDPFVPQQLMFSEPEEHDPFMPLDNVPIQDPFQPQVQEVDPFAPQEMSVGKLQTTQHQPKPEHVKQTEQHNQHVLPFPTAQMFQERINFDAGKSDTDTAKVPTGDKSFRRPRPSQGEKPLVMAEIDQSLYENTS